VSLLVRSRRETVGVVKDGRPDVFFTPRRKGIWRIALDRSATRSSSFLNNAVRARPPRRPRFANTWSARSAQSLRRLSALISNSAHLNESSVAFTVARVRS